MDAVGIDLGSAVRGETIVTRSNDVVEAREADRRRRLHRLAWKLAAVAAFLVVMDLRSHPLNSSWLPTIDFNQPFVGTFLMMIVIGVALAAMAVIVQRSPHVVYRPEEIDVRLSDVVGATSTKSEVVRSLNLFLSHRTFAREMGGTPRRGLLFAGAPGTGKTYLAKSMAGTAEVPFVFVSATAFQSMYYGATARKIRNYFRTLRKIARKEGGAIGFIEEFDAIGLARAGVGSGRGEGASGVVNELLVQMQSFDEPTNKLLFVNWFIERINTWLPAHHRIPKRVLEAPNVLIVAATNRAADLDPALLRPGRFDRTIEFDLPVRRERAEIAEFYMGRKRHDDTVVADTVAQITSGYSPVQIERLLDEALVVALRRGARAMSGQDIVDAQLVNDLGLARDGEYSTSERWRVAIHETGHALSALLLGREVGVVSILKRSQALGVTTHFVAEERHLMTRSEALDRIQICLAGMVAEELECGEASSGASGDLVTATTIAAQIVGALGMGGTLLSLEAADSMFGGNLAAKVFADSQSRERADELLEEARAKVAGLLRDRRAILRRGAELLLEHDEIDGKLLTQVMTGVID